MSRHIFKLIDHETNMAGVAVRKADNPPLQDELDQRYAQLPLEFLPNAQQIQQAITEMGIARTPQEFEDSEPLGNNDERTSHGDTAQTYLRRLGTEGALAEGSVRRKYPILDEYNVDATKLPVIRDYTSRQTTLPEHDWRMQTEGQHFDEHGNILPGAIPPVNAVKRLNSMDIHHIGNAGNFGLKPSNDSYSNKEWERFLTGWNDSALQLAQTPILPVNRAGFVSPINARDIRRATAANLDKKDSPGYVGIRGFGAPSDKAFSRTDRNEGREGIYTAPIPPNRLVGIHRKQGLDGQDIKNNLFNSAFDDEDIVQQINLPDNLPKKDFILNQMKIFDMTNDFRRFETQMDTLYKNGELSEEERDAVYDAFERGRKLESQKTREELPKEWNQGSFGFNNPILTDEEKKNYERQVLELLGYQNRDKVDDIQEFLRQGESPVLNPKGVKKAQLPTLAESDLSLDDITSLRFIPSYKRSTFNMPQVMRQNLSSRAWDYDLMDRDGGKPLPGFKEGINFDGYWLNPASRYGAMHGDVTFGGDKGILMGVAEDPHYWRTPEQGAANMSIAGEGFRYGALPKSSFVDLQAGYTPVDAQRALLEWERGQRFEGKSPSEAFDDLAVSFPEVHDVASMLPNVKTPKIWGQPAALTENPFPAQTVAGAFDPSEYKVASEPMDIAMRLLKAPVYDTDIPGIQFVTQGKGEDWTQDENLHGGLPGLWMKEGKTFSPSERAIPLDPSMADSRDINEIEQMTPNHFLEAAGKESMDDGEHYKTLMERAMAGEDMRFVMPRLSEFFPDSPPGHDGRHRMLALRNLGHGDTPVPVSVSEEHIPVQTGEPMDIAFQLLKEARPHALIDNFDLNMLLNPKSSARPKLLRRYFPHATSEDEIPMDELATEREIRRRDTDYFPLTQAQNEYREKEAPPIFANVATDKVSYDPYWQDVMTGEPMEIALQLLKERVSPEAKRHKLEYDKKYESSPERVKYREDLNRERRRRGIYGSHNHKDVSHTEGGKLTLEGEHENRARHFKDKGTLRHE